MMCKMPSEMPIKAHHIAVTYIGGSSINPEINKSKQPLKTEIATVHKALPKSFIRYLLYIIKHHAQEFFGLPLNLESLLHETIQVIYRHREMILQS